MRAMAPGDVDQRPLPGKEVLVVPPFECAWLSGEELTLRDGKGCISLEVKGTLHLPRYTAARPCGATLTVPRAARR